MGAFNSDSEKWKTDKGLTFCGEVPNQFLTLLYVKKMIKFEVNFQEWTTQMWAEEKPSSF